MNRLAQHLSVGQLVAIAQHAVYSVYHRVTRLNYEHELYAVRKRVSGETFRSFDPLALHVRDPLLCRLLSNFAPDDVFVDVGANTGVYALSVAANYPSCSITAFEPDPVVFSRLETNVRMNGFDARIDAYEMGLGARAETRPFHRSTYPELGSFNRPAAARWGGHCARDVFGSSAPARYARRTGTLATRPSENRCRRVRFGGARGRTRDDWMFTGPLIYFESHPVAEHADRVQEMQTFFDRFDYRIESHDNAWLCTPT